MKAPMQSGGLVGPQAKPAPLSADEDYDDLVGDNPGLGPVAADEEPTSQETMHYNELEADFLETLYGPSEAAAVKMLKTAPELYQGVAKAAFTILKATHEKYEQKEGPIDPGILFGEGGMISTAVDEVFKMAQAINHPGSQDINHYSAAQLEAMRLVGEEIEKRQEDGAVSEAQDVLIDMEMEAGGGQDVPPLNSAEYNTLAGAAAPPVTEEVPMEGDPSMMQQPPQAPPQGLV